MIRTGAVVTLITEKTHGDGEYALHIDGGIIGMVVNNRPSRDGNHMYVVDFGPEGQWNCTERELRAERDEDIVEDSGYIYARDPEEIDDDDEDDEEYYDEEEDEEATDIPAPPISQPTREPILQVQDDSIDFERDLERKMMELEKEQHKPKRLLF